MPGEIITTDYYETDEQIAAYCEFHYGDAHLGVANYPQRCAEICLELAAGGKMSRALDLGCAVGRSTFELARGFGAVTGVDFSQGFIDTANAIKKSSSIRYALKDEGDLFSEYERNLSDLSLNEYRDNVTFCQGDAQKLDPSLTDLDLVFAGNLIDRLRDPRLFLGGIGERVDAGGLLVITSPYTWLTDFTPRDSWLGGFMHNGREFTTVDGLGESLSAKFKLIGSERDIPFVIRETRRKFQHTIAAMTVWRRK